MAGIYNWIFVKHNKYLIEFLEKTSFIKQHPYRVLISVV